jgi:hypothetical protein
MPTVNIPEVGAVNFPDSMSQEDIVKAIQNDILPKAKAPEPEPTKDTGVLSMMGRGIARGAKQTGSALFDVLPAMAASAVGADEYAAKQMAEAAQTQKEIEQKYGARYKSLEDVKGVGDYIPFALETISEQVPNIATALIPGVGGGALAARTAAGMAAKEAAKRVAVGQAGGAYLGSYALNAPEIFQNIYQETDGQMEPGAALLAGSVSAALDAVLPAYLLNKLTPGVKAGVVERLLEKSGMPSDIARKVIGGAVTGAATEGPTEAAQEAISIAAEKFVQDNAPVWGSKEFNRLIESGVRGAVGGGGFGSIAGAGQSLVNRAETKRNTAEFKEVVTEDFRTSFEEANGREPTKEEEDTFVSNVIKARDAEEAESGSTGIDTRTDEPGVSVSGEPEIKADGVAVGAEGTTPRGVDGDTGVAGTPAAGEAVEPSPLTDEQIAEKAAEFQAKRNALLTPKGRIPLASSKKGKEYQALVVAEEEFIKTAMAQRAAPSVAPISDVIEGSSGEKVRNITTNSGQSFDVDASIAPNVKAINDAGFTTAQSMSGMEEDYKGTKAEGRYSPNGYLAFYKDDLTKEQQQQVIKAAKDAGLEVKTDRYIFFQPAISVRFAPTESGRGSEEVLAQAGTEAALELGAKENEIENEKESVYFGKMVGGLLSKEGEKRIAKEKGITPEEVYEQWHKLRNQKETEIYKNDPPVNDATRRQMWDKFTGTLTGTKAPTSIEPTAVEEAAPAKAKEMAQGDTVSPPKPKKQTKVKKQVDDFIDDFDDVPDRLSRDDLDNLLADPVATKKRNTSPKANQVPINDPLFKSAHPTVLRAINDNDIAGVLTALKNTAGTFISSFADRIMGLGITTQIGWDDVHVELAMKSLSSVDGQKNRIINWIKQIYPEVYRNKFDESKMQTPVTQMLASFQDVQR